MENYERIFNRFDEHGDGKISPAELRRCIGAISGEMTEEEAAAAARLIDSDGDGLLTLEDFVRIVEGAGEEERASDLREAFKLYELEGGGCITPKSLKRMLSKLRERRSVEQCGDMIAPSGDAPPGGATPSADARPPGDTVLLRLMVQRMNVTDFHIEQIANRFSWRQIVLGPLCVGVLVILIGDFSMIFAKAGIVDLCRRINTTFTIELSKVFTD